MTADRLVIRNFRNIENQTVVFSEGTNVLWGENAQGKTNILEAMFLLSCGRSFRGANDRELTRHGERGFSLALSFRTRERDMKIELEYGGRKAFRLNGAPVRRTADVVGRFCCVLFAPEHLSLIKGGPAEKRRFTDMALCQMKPAVFSALSDYQRVVSQKNALLRAAAEGRASLSSLDVWNERLAALCVVIQKNRAEFLESCRSRAAEVQRELSSGREELGIVYEPSPAGEDGAALSEGGIMDRLNALREREAAAGGCLIGAQRDSFAVLINGRDARDFASQGQQRSAVLALKNAECAVLGEAVGEEPTLLLDDVLSELDPFRRAYVLSSVRDRQVILTCCEAESAENIGRVRFMKVKNGAVTGEDPV